jgi:hypothetical protein
VDASLLSWIDPNAVRVVIAGGLGGAVRAVTLSLSVRQTLTTMFVGAVSGFYLRPIAGPIINDGLGFLIQIPADQEMVGVFAIGLGGPLLVGFFIDLWNHTKRLRKDDQ